MGRWGGNQAEGQRFSKSSQALCVCTRLTYRGEKTGKKEKRKKKRGSMAPLPTNAALPPLMLIL